MEQLISVERETQIISYELLSHNRHKGKGRWVKRGMTVCFVFRALHNDYLRMPPALAAEINNKLSYPSLGQEDVFSIEGYVFM